MGLGAWYFYQEPPVAELSEHRKLGKCFTLLTGLTLRRDSPYLTMIDEKKKSAREICSELIADVYIDTDGLVKSRSPENIYAKEILARLQLVHQTWYSRVGFTTNEVEYATSAAVDVQTGGNYLTWILFSEGKRSSDLFSTNQTPLAVRHSPVREKWLLEYQGGYNILNDRDSRTWRNQPHNIDYPDKPSGEEVMGAWFPDFIPTGELLGFRLTMPRSPAQVSKEFKLPTTSFGGGILGSQAYILTNTNLIRDEIPNGATLMHRRWGESIMRDFLCRELPVLNELDVIANVNMASEVIFQRSPICMKCHQTMDPLAAGIRNVVNTLTGFTDNDPFNSRIARQVLPRFADKDMPLTLGKGDSDYARTTPHGQLNYRDVDDKLVQFNFSNLNEVGEFIGKSKDYHYCVAKRYVKYFTGYDFDVTVKAGAYPEAKDFLALADRFYTHGNPKELIKDIFASPLFTRESKQ
jgi:hypothetical protein